jgi:gas vesicle protein
LSPFFDDARRAPEARRCPAHGNYSLHFLHGVAAAFLIVWSQTDTETEREALTMDEKKLDASISSGWYLLGGLAVGAVAGLLLAPKKGSETLEDISAWRERARQKTRAVLTQIGTIPQHVRAAARSAKAEANEAFDETHNKTKEFASK